MDPRRGRGRAHVNPPHVPRLSIVLPVYNEGENISPLLLGIQAAAQSQPFEALVIYDMDGDSTLPVIERLQGQVPQVRIHHNRLGPGVLNAIRSGFAVAGAPYVLVMMADGSDDPSAIDRMLALAEAGADVVAASRYMPGGRQLGGPRLKRFLSKAAGLSLHAVRALPIYDATSNFRLYSKRLLEKVTIESRAGFELALELTVKAHLLGFRLAETPTIWRDRTSGKSRFRLWQWLPHYLRWYLVAVAGRLRLSLEERHVSLP